MICLNKDLMVSQKHFSHIKSSPSKREKEKKNGINEDKKRPTPGTCFKFLNTRYINPLSMRVPLFQNQQVWYKFHLSRTINIKVIEPNTF